MAKTQRVRHLRHRTLSGLTRGPAHRRRLRHLDAWLDRITSDLGGTAGAIAVVATNATNLFTAAANGLEIGEVVRVAGTAVPTGLSAGVDYNVIPLDTAAGTFSLASTAENARAGEALAFTTDGTAVTVTRQISNEAIEQLMRSGIRSGRIEVATDIDTV